MNGLEWRVGDGGWCCHAMPMHMPPDSGVRLEMASLGTVLYVGRMGEKGMLG